MLDPDARRMLDEASDSLPLDKLSPQAARQQMREQTRLLGEGPQVRSVTDVAAPGSRGPITIRVYRQAEAGETSAAIVFFHGGGWVIGDIETHDAMCRSLTHITQTTVFSVDYRLAPEHRYPAAMEDCYEATGWIADNAARWEIDPARLAVGGDSAGGNLAAVVAMAARDRHGPAIAQQLLLYPITDFDLQRRSYQDFADGFMLTRGAMRWFWKQYLSHPSEGFEPYASPMRAKDLRRLPPAVVLTAEYDPLRDEGEDFANRLIADGVAVSVLRASGMLHGFLRRTRQIAAGREPLRWLANCVRFQLRSGDYVSHWT